MPAQALHRGLFAHGVATIVLLLALLGLLFSDPLPLQSLRHFAMDAMQRLHPRTLTTQLPIRVVAIDEESLNKHGQWPWPRKTLAELIQQLRSLGARGVVLDMVLAEPDRTSPEQVAKLWRGDAALKAQLQQMISHDQLLAQQMAQLPIVVGQLVQRQATPTIASKAQFPQLGELDRQAIPHYGGVIANQPALQQAAKGSGVISQPKNSGDGVLRRVHLLFRQGDQLHPSLSLETLRVWAGAENILLQGEAGELTGLDVRSIHIPTQADGSVWLYYRPVDNRRYIPAHGVLARDIEATQIKDHWIFIGATAQGLADRSYSSLGEVIPGVEVHLQLLEQLIFGLSLLQPEWDKLLISVLLLLFCAGLWRWGRPQQLKKLGLYYLFWLMALPLLMGGLFVAAGWLIDPLFIMLGVTLLMMVHLGPQLWLLERQRRLLADRNTFWAHINHEIRTPLNPIIGLTHLTLSTDLDEQQREYLARIEASSQALLSIINQSLDLAKMDAGHFSVDRIPFSVNGVLERVSSLYMVRAKEKDIHFETHLDEAIPQVLMGDPLRLEQVLGNLLSNAIKFTHEGKIALQISQQTVESANQVCLSFSVCDSGIGMTQEQMDKLFQPFVQAEENISRKYGGTGLGLTICQRLVEMMGGEIEIESQPGQGSCFRYEIGFPLPSAAALSAFAIPKGKQPPPRFNHAKILVAEDNGTNRLLIEELLSSVELDATLVENGQLALEALEQGAFSAVLMDVQMPVMDGHEATRRIRKQSAWKRLPIIAMTGQTLAHEQEMCMISGMSDYISKPVNPPLLFETLAKWLPCVRVQQEEPAVVERPSVDADLSALEGLELDRALTMVGGEQPRLRQMLRIFQQDHQDDAEQLESMLQSAQWSRAAALTHALKGAAGNLGAGELAGVVGELEQACKRQQADPALLRQLRQLLGQLMQGIDGLQPESFSEQGVIDKFLGFYNDKTHDIKNYIYISWILWAYLVTKQKKVLQNLSNNLPFYNKIPNNIRAITLNYTDFLHLNIGIDNSIYFHGGLSEYVRMDTRDLIEIENLLDTEPLDFIKDTIIPNIDVSSNDTRMHKHVIPALVPPLRLKPILSHKYIQKWSNASNWIKEAEKVIVVGYSFNNADEHFNDIVRGHLSAQFIIVTPDAITSSYKERMEKVFRIPSSQYAVMKTQGKKALKAGNVTLIPACADEIDLTKLFS
uniref:histidine kinase n=1 Tax=Magnetococcus massalia (strain MO-1) TaxID=451514 RepID=A0A1S7LNN7_MAGMO|nr:Putative histidine kinase [Candidatus Magnetococcus massalia]